MRLHAASAALVSSAWEPLSAHARQTSSFGLPLQLRELQWSEMLVWCLTIVLEITWGICRRAGKGTPLSES